MEFSLLTISYNPIIFSTSESLLSNIHSRTFKLRTSNFSDHSHPLENVDKCSHANQEMSINSHRASHTWSNKLTILEYLFFPNEFFAFISWKLELEWRRFTDLPDNKSCRRSREKVVETKYIPFPIR